MSEELKETTEVVVEEKAKKDPISEAKLEVIVAVLLGVTALLTAWASWIGSLHGGNQATNYAKSNNLSAEGNSEWNEASQYLMQDMILWNEITDLQLEITCAENNHDNEALEVAAYKLYYKCFDNLTDAMAEKIGFDFEEAGDADPVDYVQDWMQLDEAVTSPFDDDFMASYYEDASAKIAESDEVLVEGQQDNAHGDAYNLVTVIYSLVLFLLGIAGTFKKIPNRMIIVIAAAIGFVIATIYMITIPMPTGFNLANFF